MALSIVAALVGVAIELEGLVLGAVAVAAAAATLWLTGRLRAARLRARLEEVLAAGEQDPVLFDRIVDVFERDWPLRFAQLVAWNDDGAGGTVRLSRGSPALSHAELTSWLLREGESRRDLLVDERNELGSDGETIALPLRRENSSLVGFLVLSGSRRPPPHVVVTARAALDEIGLAVADAMRPNVVRLRSTTEPRRVERVV
jgi:hypothetical protein